MTRNQEGTGCPLHEVDVVTHFCVEFAHSDHLGLGLRPLVVGEELGHIELPGLDLVSEVVTLLAPAAAPHKLQEAVSLEFTHPENTTQVCSEKIVWSRKSAARKKTDDFQ